MAELTFNSAELRNVEVVACVCGYSQSPISSFPISLLNAFKTIQQLYNESLLMIKQKKRLSRDLDTTVHIDQVEINGDSLVSISL